MKRLVDLVRQTKQLIIEDSLFRNAVFLVASTAIMSALGFGFWIFVAHLYPPEQIGEASALISVTTLISNISLLGLNAGLVRFLPTSKNQSRDINAAIITVGVVTMLAAAAYLAIGRLFGIHVSLLVTPWHQAAFVVLMAAVSLNTLTDAVFVANRRAEYHTLVYAVFGFVKLILPIFLIPFGSLGVFMAYMLAVIASLLLSLLFMKRVSNYKISAQPNWNVLKQTRKFATNNYIGVILAGLPSQLMPLFIIKHLGTAEVAFFSMAWTMANLLYIVPSAATQSLLAESSHDPQQKSKNVRRTAKLLAAVLIPCILLSVLVAPYLLRIFGIQYSTGSTFIFQILAVSTIFIAINTVRNTVLNIEHRSSGIVLAQAATLVTTMGSITFLIRYGLPGVGLSLLLGNIASNVCHYFVYRYNRKHPVLHTIVPVEAEETITRENVGELLRAYGVTNFSFKQLANGNNSYTFLIKQRVDTLHVLRVYKKGKKTESEIETEVNFMRYLQQEGLPVPVVIPNLKKSLVSQISQNDRQWQGILMEFASGTHPDQYNANIIYSMAKNQARIHIHGQEYAKNRTLAYNRHLASLPEKLSPLRFAPKGFSHFDFDATNVLADDRGITSILDFEGARHGPLVACIYFTLTQIYNKKPDIDGLQLYLTTYQQIRVLTWIEKVILGMALALKYKKLKLLFVHK
ncbi:MAG TPA: phosphotransferase [Patescibacteria group bacterium]|nr:phosphotransferase [Patescibacteria group bacterium]